MGSTDLALYNSCIEDLCGKSSGLAGVFVVSDFLDKNFGGWTGLAKKARTSGFAYPYSLSPLFSEFTGFPSSTKTNKFQFEEDRRPV